MYVRTCTSVKISSLNHSFDNVHVVLQQQTYKWMVTCYLYVYRILPGKGPWALAVQRRKSDGGHLRELPGAYQGTFMR